MSEHIEVAGYCPMGCGMTLVLAGQEWSCEGNITCSSPSCPRPTAAHELLQDDETEHIVRLRRGNFTVQHPLRERLDGSLYNCKVHDFFAKGEGFPISKDEATYRMTPKGEGWDFQRID